MASRTFSLRSVLLVVLLAGIGAGATAYSLANVFAAGNSGSTQNTQTLTSSGHWYAYNPALNGPGQAGSGPWSGDHNGSFLTFRALSTVSNVTVAGFNIVDATHFTMNLSYHGTGSAPAITVVGFAPGLTGSNTLSAGWSSPTTVSVSMTGTGSLSTSTHLQALIVPFTGP